MAGADAREAWHVEVGDELLKQYHVTVAPGAGKGTDPFPVVGDDPDTHIVPEYAVSV